MNSIDDDAKIAGINKELWERFKEMYDPKEISDGKPTAPTLTQAEFESIVGQIDDKEAEARHRASMAQRWFGYYRKCTSQEKKFKLIDQYNSLAKPKERC